MEVIDSMVEGIVDKGYRRLLECGEGGEPRFDVGFGGEEAEAIFLDRLLRKEQTLLANYPNAIGKEESTGEKSSSSSFDSNRIVHAAARLHFDPERFVLARRYVFCNSK